MVMETGLKIRDHLRSSFGGLMILTEEFQARILLERVL